MYLYLVVDKDIHVDVFAFDSLDKAIEKFNDILKETEPSCITNVTQDRENMNFQCFGKGWNGDEFIFYIEKIKLNAI